MTDHTDTTLTDTERRALDMASTVFGWQHLARYSGMTPEWLNTTLLAMVRSVINATDVDSIVAARVAAARAERDAEWVAGINGVMSVRWDGRSRYRAATLNEVHAGLRALTEGADQ